MRAGRLAFQKVVLAAEVAILALGILLVTTNHEGLDSQAVLERTKTLTEEGASSIWQWMESTFGSAQPGDESK